MTTFAALAPKVTPLGAEAKALVEHAEGNDWAAMYRESTLPSLP